VPGIEGFTLQAGDFRSVGAGLSRPECIVADLRLLVSIIVNFMSVNSDSRSSNLPKCSGPE